MDSIADLTHALIDAAKAAGAEAADAVAVSGTSVSVGVRAGQLEEAERSESTDIGLRVIIGQKQACVSASDTKQQTIDEMASRAVAMARHAPDDPCVGLADPTQLAQDRDVSPLQLHDPAPEPQADNLQDDAQRAEEAALAQSGISAVQSASAGYSLRRVHFAASNGFDGGYVRSERGISCVAITGTGASMERDHCGESRTFQSDLPSPENIGRTAAERTLSRAGARKPPTGSYPVLFDERISSSLIGHLLSAINGTQIVRGTSWLRGALGERVLPEGLSLTEDPFRPRVSSSRMFDGEGLPKHRRDIIQDGILLGYTLDLATARKLGMDSTANAVRGTGTPPSPSAGNVALTQGAATKQDLIAQMGTGLLVTSLIGSTINDNTGDYSRGAVGHWVENGEIQYPVNECTIAGNLRDMLGHIIPANDARLHLSRVVPSLLVERMTLAGA